MTNEFGVELDQNGYAPSILQSFDGCYCCLRNMKLERHEVFHGSLLRDRSKKYGLWVNLCHHCHFRMHNGDLRMANAVKRDAQIQAMEHYGWSIDDFRERFGKNYV